jgi:uncharacterized protein (DUF1810 family)
MATQRYSVTPHPIDTLLTWVKSGEIAIPEIQRPFVWEATKVRNLLDSLYQGYPVGYLADPLLRQRLEAVISVIEEQLSQPSQSLEHLMGSELDAAKTVSSLTLFDAAGLESAAALLDRIGWRCARTLEILG